MPALYNNKLTRKQSIFVEEYLKTFNATQSAIDARFVELKQTTGAEFLIFEKHLQSNRARINCDIRKGFIYILRADNGLVKIGRTIDIQRRLNTFNSQLPYDLEVIKIIESDDCSNLELEFHNQFADKRVRGEWFALTPKDLEVFNV